MCTSRNGGSLPVHHGDRLSIFKWATVGKAGQDGAGAITRVASPGTPFWTPQTVGVGNFIPGTPNGQALPQIYTQKPYGLRAPSTIPTGGGTLIAAVTVDTTRVIFSGH